MVAAGSAVRSKACRPTPGEALASSARTSGTRSQCSTPAPAGPRTAGCARRVGGKPALRGGRAVAALAARPDAPPALVAVVTGGYVGKLVQVARANAVNIVLSASDASGRRAARGAAGLRQPGGGTGAAARRADQRTRHRAYRGSEQGWYWQEHARGPVCDRSGLPVPDGQLYVDLRGADAVPADPSEVLERMLWSLASPRARSRGPSMGASPSIARCCPGAVP